jgi:hypothetical protein
MKSLLTLSLMFALAVSALACDTCDTCDGICSDCSKADCGDTGSDCDGVCSDCSKAGRCGASSDCHDSSGCGVCDGTEPSGLVPAESPAPVSPPLNLQESERFVVEVNGQKVEKVTFYQQVGVGPGQEPLNVTLTDVLPPESRLLSPEPGSIKLWGNVTGQASLQVEEDGGPLRLTFRLENVVKTEAQGSCGGASSSEGGTCGCGSPQSSATPRQGGVRLASASPSPARPSGQEVAASGCGCGEEADESPYLTFVRYQATAGGIDPTQWAKVALKVPPGTLVVGQKNEVTLTAWTRVKNGRAKGITLFLPQQMKGVTLALQEPPRGFAVHEIAKGTLLQREVPGATEKVVLRLEVTPTAAGPLRLERLFRLDVALPQLVGPRAEPPADWTVAREEDSGAIYFGSVTVEAR